jgi:hypothetical protein
MSDNGISAFDTGVSSGLSSVHYRLCVKGTKATVYVLTGGSARIRSEKLMGIRYTEGVFTVTRCGGNTETGSQEARP